MNAQPEDRLIAPLRGKHDERIGERVRCRKADVVSGTHVSIRGDATYDPILELGTLSDLN